jgi:recombination protein RecR
MGLTLLQWPEDKVRGLGESLIQLREALCLCSQCGCLTDEDPCSICSDPGRRGDVLCVVADLDSLLVIDEAGLFRGRYLVLGGLLSPLDGIQSSQLEFGRLRERLRQGDIEEVILALGTTRDGETTESYVADVIQSEFPHIRVSRLAQGIPVGSQLKYMDQETLRQSFSYRQPLR